MCSIPGPATAEIITTYSGRRAKMRRVMKRFTDLEANVQTSALEATTLFLRPSAIRGVVLGIFALALLAGSACVNVTVHVRTSGGGGLTGTHCKLQRPLTNQHQETNVWCWAASAHTVIEYLKNQPI